LVAGLLLLAPLFAGCVYRMNIQQGNYLEGRTVDQLQVGMTRSQVRYLLGTPMVPNAFDKERWDYLYYFKARPPEEGGGNGTSSCISRRTSGPFPARQRAECRTGGAGSGPVARKVSDSVVDLEKAACGGLRPFFGQ